MDSAVERMTAEYENLGQRFVLGKPKYTSQYAQMYFARLMEMYPLLASQSQKKWPGTPIVKLLCLEDAKEQVIVGTLYKEMKLRPSALKEYTEDRTLSQQLAAEKFCDDSDALIIEDESARVALSGAGLDTGRQVTGTILAARGTFDSKSGLFAVTEFIHAGLPRQPPRPELPEDKYIALVSGLCVGETSSDAHRLALLIDWMTGLLGDPDLCRRIARVIIVGGTMGSVEELAAATAASREQRFAMSAVHDVDRCACELAAALPVDLMPGPGDLSNVALPQQPLHRCLFPGAAPFESFCRVTNPYECAVDGVRLLGTSGQNVADIMRYSSADNVLEVMADNLRQRHLCPTAPDTLACYPFTDQDPFILHAAPHVYFVGNQHEYGVSEVVGGEGQAVKLVSVPAFVRTGTLVLLNLRTLESRPVHFDAAF